MEVKINKDIREYSESVFFGLTLRQFIFSILACIVAVVLYFVLKPFLGIETLSWVCILGAAPFAVLGFVKYNGMTAEQIVGAWIRCKILSSRTLVFKADNYYAIKYKSLIEKNLKKDFIKNKKKHNHKDKIINKLKAFKSRKNKKNKKESDNSAKNFNEDI